MICFIHMFELLNSFYHWKWKIRSAKQSTDIIPVVFNSFKMVQLIVEIVFYAETEHRK